MYLLKKLFSNKLFLSGFLIIGGIFLLSILYFIFFHDQIPTTTLLYDSDDKPLSGPYSFQHVPPFGTDNFGRNLAVVLLIGAKYTIAAALFITFLRVFPSIGFGLIIHFFLRRFERPIKSIADALNYFPVTLLAYLILSVLLIQEARTMYTGVGVNFVEGPEPLSASLQIAVYFLVLSILFIPGNSILIANEVKRIYNMEFIESSRTLGATTWQIVFKHIKPFLIPQIFIIFIRDFIQTLILMSHLAVLGIFLGGYVTKSDLFNLDRYVSNSNEWAGLLGMWWEFLWTTYPWISFLPIIFLTILILCSKGMMNGLQMELAAMDSKREPTIKQEGLEYSKSKNPFERITLR